MFQRLKCCLGVSALLTGVSLYLVTTKDDSDPRAVRGQGQPVGRLMSTDEGPRQANFTLNIPDLQILPEGATKDYHIDIIDRPTEAVAKYNKSLEQTHAICNPTARVGKDGDGGWDLCLAGPYQPGSSCLVYSFGIENDWSLDDGMAERFNCTVKSFDPSMGQHRTPFKRSERVFFYPYGLGGYDRVNKMNWQMKSFKSILKEFGDLEKIIDYLKFDIERSEWEALDSMLETGVLRNVKQIALETHTRLPNQKNDISNLEYHYYLRLFRGLHLQGFRRWKVEPNPLCVNTRFKEKGGFLDPLYDCHNMVYINKNFLR